ncbi:MAG TPA: hypothetical protein VHS78_17785 [Candidatus Elarobacter sp.]|jgi:hypothetical protein|nr:hypothetical protein [Candidatus Elarobacter sp.]
MSRFTVAALAAACAISPSIPVRAQMSQFSATPPPVFASGSGETSGYAYRDESLVIFRTYEKDGTTLHLRNIGARALRVALAFDCPTVPSCPLPTSIIVPAVTIKTDASQDRTYRTPGATAHPFRWEVRLADSGSQVQAPTRVAAPRALVTGHGETDSPVRVGNAQLKFFLARDAHSTGIYVRNVGRQRVHIRLQPHCEAVELCPMLADAVVPPVSDPRDGRNDYIYTAQTLGKNFTFDWAAWIIDDPALK